MTYDTFKFRETLKTSKNHSSISLLGSFIQHPLSQHIEKKLLLHVNINNKNNNNNNQEIDIEFCLCQQLVIIEMSSLAVHVT